MLSKKSMKVISIIALALIVFTFLGTTVFAAPISSQFNADPSIMEKTGAGDTVNKVLGVIKWIGIAIAVGMLMYIGIKYLTSSPEGKANIKGILGTYLLGFALVSFATVIVGILEQVV